MQIIALATLLLVSSVSANQHEVVNSPAGQHHQQQQQQHGSAQVVGGAPVPVNHPSSVVSGEVNQVQPASGEQQVVPQSSPAHYQPHPVEASYYAPAGIIQVAGNEQVIGASKPVGGAVRNYEQYGQPESASIPANYKPWGSWGLYIGGNPADGYYTNYYKALSNSVDKQQVAAGSSEQSAKPSQVAAFNPILRQAGSSPYNGGDYYPFAYSPSEFAYGSQGVHPSAVAQQHQQGAPVAAVGQVYSGAANHEAGNALSYADSHANKKLGQSAVSGSSVGPVQSKGYVLQQQQRVAYAYSPIHQSVGPAGQLQQPQVVAYPVPVGSQIVGSQQGVDGAFNPYGVHAFTRYAIKPTVVQHSDQGYYYSVPVQAVYQQYPAYKQQGVQQRSAVHQQQPSSNVDAQHAPAAVYQSYYGYPLSQLHYSMGSIVPSGAVQGSSNPAEVVGPASVIHSGVAPVGEQQSVPVGHVHHHNSHHHNQPSPAQVEAVPSESSPQVNKQQQKRA